MVRIRSDIEALRGYTPGEQPQDGGWIKLNTNENAECSPAALAALHALGPDDLRLYPDPQAVKLRSKLAAMLRVQPDQIVVGNGSDDILNLLIRATCSTADSVVCTRPSYSLYPVLASIQGARVVEVPLGPDFALPIKQLSSTRGAILIITNPNNPAGTWYPPEQVAQICESGQNLVVIDEAYADFAESDCAKLLERFDNVCSVRSLSKSYGLAGLRVGYLAGPPALAAALMKIKDSYNVSRAAQVAALAALNDEDWAKQAWQRLVSLRERLSRSLTEDFGLKVYPSQANFILVDFGEHSASAALAALRERRILVRHFAGDPMVANCLRITVGTADQIGTLLEALREWLPVERAAKAGRR